MKQMGNLGDYIFCAMDLIIILLLIQWVKVSKLVKIEAKAGNKFVFSAMFYLVAALSFFQYEGVLRYIQTISLIIIGTLFYFVKSGISEKGIIMTGVLSDWKKCGKIKMNYTDGCVSFQGKTRPVKLYFEKDQLNAVRDILNHSNKKK